MSATKDWFLNIRIITRTKRQAKLLEALILDTTDNVRPHSVSTNVQGRRRYRLKEPTND